jgi:large subunit ribosomal protein L19
MNPIINEVTSAQVRKDITPFKVGDGVRVHTKVREGDKERVQVYSGIVIARKGHGIHETFTVRRISYGEGVERVFPVNSPNIEKVEVERESEVMKARLYYLRNRTGKAAVAIKEKDRSAQIHAAKLAAAHAPAAPAEAAAPAEPAAPGAPAAPAAPAAS